MQEIRSDETTEEEKSKEKDHNTSRSARIKNKPFKEALETALRLVNLIKMTVIKNPLFRRLCQDIESNYKGLLFHADVRWLSIDIMLNKFVHFIPEAADFLEERNKEVMKVAVADSKFQRGWHFSRTCSFN